VEDDVSSLWQQLGAAVGASTLTLAVSVLVLFALAHFLLRWWIKRRARQDDAGADEAPENDLRLRRWVTRGLKEILPALALLLWIHGLYFTAGLLIRQAGQSVLPSCSLTGAH
jgi:hypothetical protein